MYVCVHRYMYTHPFLPSSSFLKQRKEVCVMRVFSSSAEKQKKCVCIHISMHTYIYHTRKEGCVSFPLFSFSAYILLDIFCAARKKEEGRNACVYIYLCLHTYCIFIVWAGRPGSSVWQRRRGKIECVCIHISMHTRPA